MELVSNWLGTWSCTRFAIDRIHPQTRLEPDPNVLYPITSKLVSCQFRTGSYVLEVVRKLIRAHWY